MTWTMRRRSASAGGRPGATSISRSWRPPALVKAFLARSTRPATSTGPGSTDSEPVSMRARSSRSPILTGEPPPVSAIFPQAPPGLTVLAGDRQVVLSWESVFLATGWEYSTDGGAAWTSTGGAATVHTVTGLTNGTEYTFRVRTVREVLGGLVTQYGAASAGVAATPALDETAPSVDSASANGTSLVITFDENLAPAASLSNDAFTVRRTPAGGSEGEVSLSGAASPAVSGAEVTLTLAAALAHDDTGVKVSYRKPATDAGNRLEDASGNETADFTDENVSNDTPAPPAAPGNVSAAPGDGLVTLAWDTIPGAASYQYERDGGAWTAATPAVNGTRATHDVTGLSNGQAYTFRVRGVNANGVPGAASESASAVPVKQCVRALAGNGTVSGVFGPGCDSERRRGRHAGFFTFALAGPSDVTITLESSGDTVDTYLYLARGSSRSGYFDYKNDDIGGNPYSYNSRIQADGLAAGTYTIEATTRDAGRTGGYTLTLAGLGDTAPRFTGGTAFNAAENQQAVGTVTAADNDPLDAADPPTFALTGGVDRSKFAITTAGELTFASSPDYENPTDVLSTTPADAAGNNVYIVEVTATSGTGARQRTASQTLAVTVTDANDAPTGTPTISGTEQVGQTLTASTGDIADQDGLTGVAFNYQWRRVDGGTATDISGATSSTYALAAADQGKKVRVKVTFTDQGGFANSVESADSGVIAAAAATDTAPRFTSAASFNAAENQQAVATVTAVDDDPPDTAPTFALTGGVDQSKFAITSAGVLTFAAAPDYENPTDVESTTPSNGAGNNEYVVEVTATSGTGARQRTASQTLAVTVTDVNDAPTGQPTISGTERVGETLTASVSAIADQDGLTGVAFNYQWRRVDGGNATDISGANSATYALAAADQGKQVRVKVTFTDQGGFANGAESADSGVIAAADHATAPDAIANIQVTHNGRSLTVSWDAPARATAYDVTYYDTGSGQHARAAWNRAGTSLTVTCDSRDGTNCVSPGTAYTVGVRARNSAGESAWADSAQTPLPPAPGAVSNIRVTHNGGSLTVSWDAPAGATAYDVTFADAGTLDWKRAAWGRAGNSITISVDVDGNNAIDGDTTYVVGVRALNAGGESAWVNSDPAND